VADTPTLFDPDGDDDAGDPGTIQARFEAFHRQNPCVLESLERLTESWLATGRRRLGIGMLWEVLRWELSLATTDPSGEFKLNNVYRSRYVRLLIERHPEWADCFETRTLKAA
jgi:hypothetical protein